jgi:hypothetical protein
MQRNRITIGAALIPLLGLLLLTNPMVTSYAYAESVKILAKEKQGMILLLVRNGNSADIHSIKLSILDSEVTSVKPSQGWKVASATDSSVTLTTNTSPIKPRERIVFSLGANNTNTIISWQVLDRSGSIIEKDNTRTIVRLELDRTVPYDKESRLIQDARSVGITTDKIFYNKNDKMFISGILDPNEPIKITIYAPNGQKMKISDKTDLSGSFRVLHVLQDAQSGTYRLKVSQTENSAEIAFRVL